MKRIIKTMLAILLLLCLFGCAKKDPSPVEVADSIADISSDIEGNVIVTLANGKTYTLGNLKGEKGDKGDPGKDGVNGLNGRDGVNGTNGTNGRDGRDGTNGKDGKDGKDGTIPGTYVMGIEIADDGKTYVIYGDGTKEYERRVQLNGDYELTIEYLYKGKSLSKIHNAYFNESEKVTFGLSSYPRVNDTYYEIDSVESDDTSLSKEEVSPGYYPSNQYTFTGSSKDVNVKVNLKDHIKFYDVYFDKNGHGKDSEVPPMLRISARSPYVTIEGNSEYLMSDEQPGENNYYFDGWFTQPEGGFRIYDFEDNDYTSDTTVYARWIKYIKCSSGTYVKDYSSCPIEPVPDPEPDPSPEPTPEPVEYITISVTTDTSLSGLQNWANRYDFIFFTTEATSDYSKVNTCRIIDGNGNSLSPGQSIMLDPNTYRIRVTYYIEKEHTLDLVTTSSSDGKTLNITANMDADSRFDEWEYSEYEGLSFSENGNSLSITPNGITSSTSFTVTAYSAYGNDQSKEASITVYVSVAEDGTVTISV